MKLLYAKIFIKHKQNTWYTEVAKADVVLCGCMEMALDVV